MQRALGRGRKRGCHNDTFLWSLICIRQFCVLKTRGVAQHGNPWWQLFLVLLPLFFLIRVVHDIIFKLLTCFLPPQPVCLLVLLMSALFGDLRTAKAFFSSSAVFRKQKTWSFSGSHPKLSFTLGCTRAKCNSVRTFALDLALRCAGSRLACALGAYVQHHVSYYGDQTWAGRGEALSAAAIVCYIPASSCLCPYITLVSFH